MKKTLSDIQDYGILDEKYYDDLISKYESTANFVIDRHKDIY